MSSRVLVSVVVLYTVFGLSSIPVIAQTLTSGTGAWELSRTPWGDPDLQGQWTNTTSTPMERPEDLSDQEILTEEDLAVRDSEVAARVSFDNVSPGNVGAYNEFWVERGRLIAQTSLVVDPPTGRIPPITEAARERRRSLPRPTGGRADSHERRSLLDRCISYGVPNLLAGYNAYFQIVQAADHVAVYQELIHDARVIPIDGTPHLDDSVRQLHGDSRGRWEGDSLVVETTNYSARGAYRGATQNVRVVERFTRVADETIEYEVTFDDSDTWGQPWALMIPLSRSEESIFEYACHEGNYAMEGILAGARVEEAAATQR